jgi:glycerol-3-phosphate dehydrogenase
VVVIGSGIFGACAAWDAVLRGLSVPLVERDDFSGATSANSLNMVHGGIRYLQHGELARVRESCAERSALLRIAPHLVRPLPIAIPTYRHSKHGKALLAAGAWAYDLITQGRNRGISDPRRRIPWTRLLAREEVLSACPGLQRSGLTGAVLFNDSQIYNPPRLVLVFVRSAVGGGALAANYVEAMGLLQDGNRITGIDMAVSDLEHEPGLREECRRVQALGFTGKAAIHPKQLGPIKATFTPGPERIAYAPGCDQVDQHGRQRAAAAQQAPQRPTR